MNTPPHNSSLSPISATASPAMLSSSTATGFTAPTWWLLLLFLTALVAQGQRILTVRSSTGEMPFHSANDRSRWCSVAALGGYGQFEIDPFLQIRDPKTKRRTWNTIDMVRHRGRDGRQHYYSSKPPLLSAMHAGVYAIVRAVTGLSLVSQPFTTARIILFLVNWLPLAGFWWLWGKYWQQQSKSLWAFTVIMLLMLWGTFVSTFANTLNNHLPGAIAAGMSLWALLKIIYDGQPARRWFILAAASAAMCAVCELPALSWVAAVCLLLIQVDFKKAVMGVLVGMLPITLAFMIVNYLAHGDLRPPYAHRAVGPLVTTLDLPASTDDPTASALSTLQLAQGPIVAAVRDKDYQLSDAAKIQVTRTPGVHELWDDATQYRFALVIEGQSIKVHQWDDWYDYPNSYWYPDSKKGVDKGEPSRAVYLFHTTFGHHGLFSLTPMWLLLPLGAWSIWQLSTGAFIRRLFDLRVQVMLAIVATSLVCFVFYMLRPLEDRNYGGVSCGFRWMHWFAPLWCWLVGHALGHIRHNGWRAIVWLALGLSIFSACVPWQNPWTSPWLMP
ncbi:MAG: hypothetical protein IT423_18210 [Pirellulaceae bacterium]|nr:hypothetical protein [Pirellulaceae bacterium]